MKMFIVGAAAAFALLTISAGAALAQVEQSQRDQVLPERPLHESGADTQTSRIQKVPEVEVRKPRVHISDEKTIAPKEDVMLKDVVDFRH